MQKSKWKKAPSRRLETVVTKAHKDVLSSQNTRGFLWFDSNWLWYGGGCPCRRVLSLFPRWDSKKKDKRKKASHPWDLKVCRYEESCQVNPRCNNSFRWHNLVHHVVSSRRVCLKKNFHPIIIIITLRHRSSSDTTTIIFAQQWLSHDIISAAPRLILGFNTFLNPDLEQYDSSPFLVLLSLSSRRRISLHLTSHFHNKRIEEW